MLEYKFRKFNYKSFIAFVLDLVDSHGLNNFRAIPDNPKFFNETQLTHIAPNRDVNNKDGFAYAWSNFEKDVRKVSFHQFNKDKTRSIDFRIDLDKKLIVIDDMNGVNQDQVENILKKYINISKNRILGYVKKFIGILFIPVIIGILFMSNHPWWWPKQSIECSVNVRKLTTLETGKNIEELPNNVYFFENAMNIASSITYKDNRVRSDNKRFLSYDDFEIQKKNNEDFLIGFVSDDSYSKVGSAKDNNAIDAILFPKRFKEFNKPIAIPFNSISLIKNRIISRSLIYGFIGSDSISVFDISFNKAEDSCFH